MASSKEATTSKVIVLLYIGQKRQGTATCSSALFQTFSKATTNKKKLNRNNHLYNKRATTKIIFLSSLSKCKNFIVKPD